MIVSSTAPVSIQAPGSARAGARETNGPNQTATAERAALNDDRGIQQQLQTLKNRDREVRAHELAHQAAGGRYVTRGAQYDFERGPDGRQYAVGGDVRIDTSAVPGDPQATLEKALVVQRAALAPADPSATDRQVAARAAVMIQQARIDLALQRSSDDGAPSPGSRFEAFA